MAETINETTAQKALTKKELNEIWRRWAFTNLSSMSFEKLEAHAFAYSMVPIAESLYADDPEAQRELLERHSVFYNTEPQTGAVVNGIVASLEEDIAQGGPTTKELPNTIKTALMGPIAGIGDSLIQGIIVPVLLSIAMSLSEGGNALGPVFFIVAWGIVGPLISYLSFHKGYKLGVSAIDVIVGENAKRITNAFNVLGVIVIGALAAGNIGLTTLIEIPHGPEEVIALQEVLDGVFPNLLPLVLVLWTWHLINKKHYSPTKVIIVLCVAVSVLCMIGVF